MRGAGFLLLLLLLGARRRLCAPDEQQQLQRALLADRAWVSRQLAPAPSLPPPAACLAVAEPLRPGATVEGYELVERAALLGVCRQPRARDEAAGGDGSGDSDEDGRRDVVLELAGPSLASSSDTQQQTRSVCALPLAPPPLREGGGAGTQVAQTAAGGAAKLVDGPTLEYQVRRTEGAALMLRAATASDASPHARRSVCWRTLSSST